MAKQMVFDLDAKTKLDKGAKKLCDIVASTLGPGGRNVILQKSFGLPVVTRDGYTVAKDIEIKDVFENMGTKLMNEVSNKTNDEAGDGTTTAAIIAYYVYSEGLKYVISGANPWAIRRGLNKAVDLLVDETKKNSRSVSGLSDLENVATIASNNDKEMGKMIAKAVDKIGKEGIVTVEESKKRDTELEFAEGIQFDKGYISPYFITNADNLRCEFEDCYILLYEKKISNVMELLPILERVAQTGKSLLIIAEEIEGEALATLVLNKIQGFLNVCAVKSPAFGDRRKAIMQDIAIITGGRYISEELGRKLEEVDLVDLGKAGKVSIEKEKTTIIDGKGDKKAIEDRINQIRTQLKETTSKYDKEKLEERLAKLLGGVAIIRVGATTEAESKERKFRVDDAVHATTVARDEGIVHGGGVAYLKLAFALDSLNLEGDERFAVEILKNALRLPVKLIAQNAGKDGAEVLNEIIERAGDTGYDALNHKFVNLFEAGIIDPAKVVRLVLQNAISISSLLLSSHTLVAELKDKKKAIVDAVK